MSNGEDTQEIIARLEEQGMFPESETTEETKETQVEPEVVAETETEVTTEETTETPQETPKQDVRVTEMARQLHTLRKKVKEYEAQAAKTTKGETEQPTYNGPGELLKAHNFTYEDALNELMGAEPGSDDKPADVKDRKLAELEDKIQKLTQQLEEKDKLTEQEKQQADAQAYANALNDFLKKDETKYELIRETQNEQLVLDTIVQYYNLHNEELAWDKAADMVEDYLLDDYSKKVEKLSQLEKIKAKLNTTGEQPAVPKEQPKLPEPPAKKVQKTLTNANTSSPMPPAADELDDDERLRQAMALEAELFK